MMNVYQAVDLRTIQRTHRLTASSAGSAIMSDAQPSCLGISLVSIDKHLRHSPFCELLVSGNLLGYGRREFGLLAEVLWLRKSTANLFLKKRNQARGMVVSSRGMTPTPGGDLDRSLVRPE